MNSIEVNNHEIFKVMNLAFENNQTFILRVRGTSMFPLLKDKKGAVLCVYLLFICHNFMK